MTDTISVQNDSGQVASFLLDGPNDPRAEILRQRIARGELTEAKKSDKSRAGRRARVVVQDSDTGLKDERGDFLKSVHGGGLDPDAEGDVNGDPSGSKEIKGAVVVGGVSDAAVAQADAKPQTKPAKKAAEKRAESK